MKPTREQKKFAEQILKDGKVIPSKNTSDDYEKAAEFVFEEGWFFLYHQQSKGVRT